MYKVWISIEKCDEKHDKYENIGLPDCLGRFAGLDKAEAFVRTLLVQHAPDQLPHSDHR